MSPQNSASPTASLSGLPISLVAIAPSSSLRSTKSSAIRATTLARSSIGTSFQASYAVSAPASAASISASVAVSKVCSTSPVAGLTIWYVGDDVWVWVIGSLLARGLHYETSRFAYRCSSGCLLETGGSAQARFSQGPTGTVVPVAGRPPGTTGSE